MVLDPVSITLLMLASRREFVLFYFFFRGVSCIGFFSQITRDYDEEEQGYDSEKERGDRKDSDDSALSPRSVEGNGTARSVKQAKVNGADDRHEEDMDVSD